MTTPVLDPALLDQLSRRCKSVATEIDRLGADVYALTVAVETQQAAADTVRRTTASQRTSAAPQTPSGPQASSVRPTTPAPGTPAPSTPAPGTPAPSTPTQPAPPAAAPRPVASNTPLPSPFPQGTPAGQALGQPTLPLATTVPVPAGAAARPAATVPVPATGPAAGPTASRPAAGPAWASAPMAGFGQAPRPGYGAPVPPRPAAPVPTPPREPWWERDGVVSRVLALGGVAITLIGVVMLLVLAARAGLLRPEVRVGLGVLLAGGLVAAGVHVQGRPGGRVGGIALVATGVVAGYLDILAVTSLYEWVAPAVGLGLAALVAVGGVVIARRWNSPQLLIITTIAAVLTAPVMTSGVTRTLVVFYLLLQLTGAVLELIDGWTWLAPVRTAPVVLAAVVLQMLGLGESSIETGWISSANWNLVVALVILTVGVAAASIRPERQQVPTLAALVAGGSAVPAMIALVASTRPVAMGVGIAVAAALLGARAVTPRTAGSIRTVDATVAGLVLAVACVAARPDDAALRALPFLVVAIVSLVLALRTDAIFVRVYAGVYSTLAALGVLVTVSPGMLASGSRALFSLTVGSALTGLLLVVASAVAVGVLWRTGLAQRWRWVLIAPVFFALYGVTAVCVALPVAVTQSIEGFHLGHLLATLTWALAGAAVLAFGLARPSWARLCLAIGLTLIAAAVAKLLTYDLASLTGLTRAVAFLGIGLLLLVAGTRYARVFADREMPSGPDNGAGGIPPSPSHGAAPGAAPQAPVGPAAGAAHPRSAG